MQIFEVSCRKNDGWLGSLFVGELRFSSLAGRPIDRQEFLDQIAGKRVLNAAHGYHNKESQADHFAETVAARIEEAQLGYDALVLFSWSGGLTYAGFGMAVARTKACGRRLADLIALEGGAGAHVDCVSHSLGAEVSTYALQKSRSVGRWIALAAAISDTSLGPGQQFDANGLGVGRVLVTHSERDEVLQWAYPIGSGLKAALGLHGPRIGQSAAKVSARNVSEFVSSHSEAYSAPRVYEIWAQWMKGDKC